MTAMPARDSDSVLPELVDMMFTSLNSVAVVGVGLAVLAWTNSALHGDPVVAAAGFASVAVASGRILITVAYRKARPSIESAAQARVWERRYAAGGFAFTALLGGLSAYVFLTGEVAAQLLIATVMLAYPSGMIVRVSVRPVIARGQLVLTLAPPIMACLFSNSTEHLMMAALMSIYLALGFGMIDHLHLTILHRILAHRELARLALHDDLTGLPNRIQFRQRLQEECDRAGRYDNRFAVLYLDLDHFKTVNDTLGHAAGDALLRAVADRLKATARSSDVAARLGGDEFALIQTPISDEGEIRAFAQRLVETVREPFVIDGCELRIGVSIGVAVSAPPGDEPDTILKRADRELYAAKAAGRGRYSLGPDGMVDRKARPRFAQA